MSDTARIIFMGSPEFAVPILIALAERYAVVGVVTQPDRPAGRGRKLTPPPVKNCARLYDIPVIQPEKMKDPGVFEQLVEWSAEMIIVAAFGQILRQNVLKLPPLGCINVHASLLPRWRGAAPIQAAILSGDTVTGISIMQMDAGIDTGPVYTRREVKIDAEDTASSLEKKLSEVGANLLIDTLPGILSGALVAEPQEDSKATYAAMLHKEDGLLDFNQSAESLCLKIRAYYDWPGAYFLKGNEKIKVRKALALRESHLYPGQFGRKEGYPLIGTVSGAVQLVELQPPGRTWMDGRDYLRGNPGWD